LVEYTEERMLDSTDPNLAEEGNITELTAETSELRRQDRGNNHHDHDKHGKNNHPRGPPCYVCLYPLILIITMIANRCCLFKVAMTLRKLERPFAAV